MSWHRCTIVSFFNFFSGIARFNMQRQWAADEMGRIFSRRYFLSSLALALSMEQGGENLRKPHVDESNIPALLGGTGSC
jgi:hypothetical protein